jgi:hypothetical protein
MLGGGQVVSYCKNGPSALLLVLVAILIAIALLAAALQLSYVSFELHTDDGRPVVVRQAP